jgi:hypothetical protein
MILFSVAFFLLITAYGADDITTSSLGGSNAEGSVKSTEVFKATPPGTLSSTSTLTPGGDMSLTQSITTNDLTPIELIANNNKGEIAKLTYAFDDNAVKSQHDISSWTSLTAAHIEEKWDITHADHAILTASATNRKGYNANVKAEIEKGSVNTFFHEATATSTDVFAHQKIDDAQVEKITRTLSANNAYKFTTRYSQSTFIGMLPVLDYEDTAKASKDKATLTLTGGMPLPPMPPLPPFPRGSGALIWPTGQG